MLTYLITGANGHLGSTITRLLTHEPCEVRGLILPGEVPAHIGTVRYFAGDVTKPDTMEAFFGGIDAKNTVVIHAAGLIDIGGMPYEKLYRVNVEGTKNVLVLCRAHGVRRMLHISSVHAIPEHEDGRVLREVDHFSAESVKGSYARTKAEATQCVLDAVREGFDAVVVQPSGIVGPYDMAGNHIVQVVRDYMLGRLPACVRGGYDLVDVRDVAQGCLNAARNGRAGECYILSNRHYEIKDLLKMVRRFFGGRRLPVLPLWMAKIFAPIFEAAARRNGRRPLYTSYSLAALSGNHRFSHDKATMELRYSPRDMLATIEDTVAWLKEHRVRQTPPSERRKNRRK